MPMPPKSTNVERKFVWRKAHLHRVCGLADCTVGVLASVRKDRDKVGR